MYRIKEIRIIGVTRLKTDTEVNDIEKYRRECALRYNVKLSDVKFVYEEKE